jgi:hypothetical protein
MAPDAVPDLRAPPLDPPAASANDAGPVAPAPDAGLDASLSSDANASGTSTSCNDVGNPVAECKRVSPVCEGLREECMGLTVQLRPRVAQAFAECMAKSHGKSCRSRALGACMRAAVEGSCADPEATKTCEGLMAGCRAKGREPKYTLDQCAKILSATAPDAEGDWRTVDEERMGVGPSAESCSLEYVLPYQPWGFSWR